MDTSLLKDNLTSRVCLSLAIGMILFVSILATQLSSFAETGLVKSDAHKAKLIGPVKTVFTKGFPFLRTRQYDRDGRLLESVHEVNSEHFKDRGDTLIKQEYIYDRHGKKIMVNVVSRDGTPISSIAYAYDDSGNETAAVTVDMDSDREGEFDSATFRNFNHDGREIYHITYIGHNHIRKTVSIYAPDRTQMVEIHFRDGKLAYQTINKYDLKGNPVEQLHYREEGIYTGRTVSEYDERGHVIRQSNFSVDDLVKSQFSYEYQFDTVGNWVQKTMTIDVNPVNEKGDLIYESTPPVLRSMEYYGQ